MAESNQLNFRQSTLSAVSTPDSRMTDPFEDHDAISQGPKVGTDPFGTPAESRPASSSGSSSAVRGPVTRYFHSRRIKKGEVKQPWKAVKDSREIWVTALPLIGLAIGFGVAGWLVWDGYKSVVQHKYCPVMSDDFSNGFNTDIWTKEVQVGWSNGEFEQTTDTDENVFVQDGKLIIKPTLQDATLIETDNTINLTALNTCTGSSPAQCVTTTNLTTGEIIQPVKSGRVHAKSSAIKYGKVEITAKLPAGDWLWPALWMLPVNDTYGPWPRSGEIDIIESRGNNYTYPQGGNNIVTSALHWGPNPANDGWWRTNKRRTALHTDYSKGEHVFGLEWSEKYIFTYVDSLLLQVLYTGFDQPFFKWGSFPQSDSNGTLIADPWSYTGRDATPFDQEFYLIMNVAVGGTNGWFEDGKNGKPWVNHGQNPKKDFWNSKDSWYPTWQAPGAGQMEVSKVEIWQQCDGNENLQRR